MQLILDPEQQQEIKSMVVQAVNDGIKPQRSSEIFWSF